MNEYHPEYEESEDYEEDNADDDIECYWVFKLIYICLLKNS